MTSDRGDGLGAATLKMEHFMSNWAWVHQDFTKSLARFVASVSRLREEEEKPDGAYDEAFERYDASRIALQHSISAVTVFECHSDREQQQRDDVSGALLIACHQMDESWLEPLADQIFPLPGIPPE